MKRLDRWLAHVRKQLPGPVYDHPRRESKPMTDAQFMACMNAAGNLYALQGKLAARHMHGIIKGIGEFSA